MQTHTANSEVNKIQYEEFARIQLDTAICLYSDENYISALTLAGAAEEFIGKLLGDHSFHNELKSTIKTIEKTEKLSYEVNKVRNFLKHGDSENSKGLLGVNIHIKEEAYIMILRGIINYCTYKKEKTKKMSDFLDSVDESKLETIATKIKH